MAKLYEHMLLNRLVTEYEAAGGLTERQHDFRKDHSTVGAVQEVLHFARTAHRRVPSEWCMEEKGISSYLTNLIKDYLMDRAIFKNAREKLRVNVGVPQGSVLGPTLWNIIYDGVLRMEVPEGVKLIGYADDLAITVADRNLQRAVEKVNRSIELTKEWLYENGLQMTPEKTEAILLRFGRRRQEVLLADDRRIEAKDTVRYLGVTLDSAVSFGAHIRAAASRAERATTALSRLMPNIGGTGENRRRTLCSVAHSIMLYGAPIWAGSLNVASYRKSLQAVQRKLALRICRGYRTISYEAAMVMASMPLIHLMAAERKAVYDLNLVENADRAAERQRTLAKWQEEWQGGT